MAVVAVMAFAVFQAARAAVPEVIADPTARWSTWSGEMRMELRGDYLTDYGLEIVVDGQPRDDVAAIRTTVQDLGSLSLYAPAGNFSGFIDGRLNVAADVVLRHAGREVSLEQLVLTPGTRNNHPTLEARDGEGRHLLTLTHLHVLAEHEDRMLTIHNADIQVTPLLAELLELPVLTETPLGMAWLDLNLHVPAGADLSGQGTDPSGRGLSCTDRPFWPQEGHEIDVSLIHIGTVAYQGATDSGDPDNRLVKTAPSATLRNESTGDVPWIPKFDSLGGGFDYPYDPEDQHPFLVWNMYRISDGRIEQLAGSGVKHAFLTTNTGSDCLNCSSSNVLWPGCEDVYSSFTNDNNSNQGPRYDIEPSQGLFESTCSFFDPDCQSQQTNSSSSFENRLTVREEELETADAEYFLDSWYVIQYDTDIWNSMGYHEINPSPSGDGWSFGPLGPFTQGVAISNWVDESTTDPMADHVVIQVPSEDPRLPYPDNMPQGHLRVLVQVTEVAENRWRYNYAVQNYDFDRNIDRFDIPLPDGAQVFDTFFGDVEVDGEHGDPWSVDHSGGVLTFQAPENNHLRWFSLYNFEVETNAEPADNGQVLLHAAESGSPGTLTVDTLSPGVAEMIFADGFE